MEWILEAILILLLGATLFHAIRLERALGVLKRDRAELEALVSGFNASTRAAEQGIERLRDAAEGAGRQITRQVESAIRLRDDLAFLAERGERIADRLEMAVRTARGVVPQADAPEPEPEPPVPEIRPREAYRDSRESDPRDSYPMDAIAPQRVEPPPPARPRSRAEQELMRALRLTP